MIIDVHSHIFPPEYLRRIADLGGRTPQLSAAPMSSMTIGERLDLMAQEGIDMGVLSVGVLQPYHLDRSTAADLARQGNDLFLDTCAESAGHLTMFAALPLPHPDAAIEELDRLAGNESVVGVALGTSVLSHDLDDPVLFPVYAELNARGSTVFIHPSMTFGGFGDNDLGMSRTIGGMFEDTIAAVRLLLSGVCATYPRINFIIPHLGGTLPFIFGRIARHLVRKEEEWAAAGLSSEGDGAGRGMGRLWYDTAVRHEPAVRCACETVGHERLLFGTDFPYVKSKEELNTRIRNIRDLPLSDSDRDAILGNRAATLLGIKSE